MKSLMTNAEYKQEILKNEPAFPQDVILEGQKIVSSGMSLRDYFAAKALQGFCSQMPPELIKDISQGIRAGGDYIKVAGYLADAMLVEREKGQ